MRLAILIISCCLWMLISAPAWALTQIKLSDISYKDCPPELSRGAVTSGEMISANCFLIMGKAINPTNKTIYNADVFGRIYDANNNPAMQNRTRVGSIDEIPPGETRFEIRISVAANQPTPLRLEQFKASGFTGRVRRY